MLRKIKINIIIEWERELLLKLLLWLEWNEEEKNIYNTTSLTTSNFIFSCLFVSSFSSSFVSSIFAFIITTIRRTAHSVSKNRKKKFPPPLLIDFYIFSYLVSSPVRIFITFVMFIKIFIDVLLLYVVVKYRTDIWTMRNRKRREDIRRRRHLVLI